MGNSVEEVKQNIREDFVPKLEEAFGKDLLSVILYGSAAKGTFQAGVSDVNLLILTGSTHPEQIVELGKKASRDLKKLRLSLHFLTETEFLNSSDVFPMEYYDIQEHHEVLFGKDPAEDLSLTSNNLRHQVEERLRGSVNALRQALLASQGKTKLISELLVDWFGSQTALFRGALRLIDYPQIPEDNRGLFRAVAEAFEIDAGAMEKLIDLREGRKTEDSAAVAVSVLNFLTNLVKKIDTMEKNSGGRK